VNDVWQDWRFPGIYAIIHVVDGKVYVGQSQDVAHRIRGHKGGSNCPHLRSAIKLHGWNAFEIELLERVDDPALLNEREQYWIDTTQACDRTLGYNLRPTAESFRGFKHSDETKAKWSLSRKGKNHTEETKAKISASSIGKKKSREGVMKSAASKRGIPFSAEHKAKLSAARRGRPLSADHKAKLLAANLGRKMSAANIEKLTLCRREKRAQTARGRMSEQMELGL
jgi:group I intron endonuclease